MEVGIIGIFLGQFWGQITAPSQFKNEQKLPKMIYIIHFFLALHFGVNFMKITTKIPKLQMNEKFHKRKTCENLHKNVNGKFA